MLTLDSLSWIDGRDEVEVSISVKKLSKKTLVHDCHPDILKFLGITDPRGRDKYGRYYTIGDFPFDVFMCKQNVEPSELGLVRGYGKSFLEAIAAAMAREDEEWEKLKARGRG